MSPLVQLFATCLLLCFTVVSPARAESQDEHMVALRKRIPASGFTVVQQPPFVVIGDEPEAVVRLRSTTIVAFRKNFRRSL